MHLQYATIYTCIHQYCVDEPKCIREGQDYERFMFDVKPGKHMHIYTIFIYIIYTYIYDYNVSFPRTL